MKKIVFLMAMIFMFGIVVAQPIAPMPIAVKINA